MGAQKANAGCIDVDTVPFARFYHFCIACCDEYYCLSGHLCNRVYDHFEIPEGKTLFQNKRET